MQRPGEASFGGGNMEPLAILADVGRICGKNLWRRQDSGMKTCMTCFNEDGDGDD